NHPLDAGFTNSFVVVGREAESADFPEISVRRVTPGYFAAADLEVLTGRALNAGDGTTDPAVLLINETAARQFFPNGPVIGQQIRYWGTDRTIVGVVADEKFHGVAVPTPIAAYMPLAQAPPTDGVATLLVRTSGDPMSVAHGVRRAVHEIDPGLAVYGVEPLTQTLSRSLGRERFTMLLLGAFAAVALMLAVLGVHGVLSYMVARRVPEMGVRVAMGASRANVALLVMGEGARLTLIGLAIGVVSALVATRALRGLIFGVTTLDPITYVVVVATISAVGLAASWIPARRATRIDPMEALRSE
ncbi:MAG: ABC transporter permease, partial [Gemmatimonadales bacterium]